MVSPTTPSSTREGVPSRTDGAVPHPAASGVGWGEGGGGRGNSQTSLGYNHRAGNEKQTQCLCRGPWTVDRGPPPATEARSVALVTGDQKSEKSIYGMMKSRMAEMMFFAGAGLRDSTPLTLHTHTLGSLL